MMASRLMKQNIVASIHRMPSDRFSFDSARRKAGFIPALLIRRARPVNPAMALRSYKLACRSCADLAAELIFDMNADDVVKCPFGPKAKFASAPGGEVSRPSCDDLRDLVIGLAADKCRRL